MFTQTLLSLQVLRQVQCVANARNILSRATISAAFDLDGDATDVTAIPNKTVNFLNQTSKRTNSVTLSFTPTEKVSPIIDESQCKLLNIESFTSLLTFIQKRNRAIRSLIMLQQMPLKIGALNTTADNLNVKIAGVVTNQTKGQSFCQGGRKVILILRLLHTLNLNFSRVHPDTSTTIRQVVVQNFASSTDENAEQSSLGTFDQYLVSKFA